MRFAWTARQSTSRRAPPARCRAVPRRTGIHKTARQCDASWRGHMSLTWRSGGVSPSCTLYTGPSSRQPEHGTSSARGAGGRCGARRRCRSEPTMRSAGSCTTRGAARAGAGAGRAAGAGNAGAPRGSERGTSAALRERIASAASATTQDRTNEPTRRGSGRIGLRDNREWVMARADSERRASTRPAENLANRARWGWRRAGRRRRFAGGATGGELRRGPSARGGRACVGV